MHKQESSRFKPGSPVTRILTIAFLLLCLAGIGPYKRGSLKHETSIGFSERKSAEKLSLGPAQSTIRPAFPSQIPLHSGLISYQEYPPAPLERVSLQTTHQRPELKTLPDFKTEFSGRLAARSSSDDSYIFFSISPRLQKKAVELVKKSRHRHVAIVAMEPETGRILALADKSSAIPHLAFHPKIPAASLFKVVTTAAALEQSSLAPKTEIKFRGGTYTLNRWNYKPSKRYDRRSMTLETALGKSCNPVFGRVASEHLSPLTLRAYAERFMFGKELEFDLDLQSGSFQIPDDSYLLARTGAGFGDVFTSPLHAAALMNAVSSTGIFYNPSLIDRVISTSGELLYNFEPQPVSQMIDSDTSSTLLRMMEETITNGTSKKEFYRGKYPRLPGIRVTGKTGTLRGKSPVGINNWFIGAAPIHTPRIAVAVLAVKAGPGGSGASRIARQFLEFFFSKPQRT